MRAFEYEQRALFFGRERQSYGVYRLMSFGFIAVIGASGSGKSSLVRAGLLPLLDDPSEKRTWRIVMVTPGGVPIERLADGIAALDDDENEDERDVRRERIEYLLRRSSSGIADALDEMPRLSESNVLIVVDQFEEIFRNSASGDRDPASAFVQLLLHLNRYRSSARVLITMRSDFIGDCSQFAGLPEAVSETQFLVPSLSREQRRATIVKPLERAGASIEATLVERLLNDAGFENDQLPILQHALMRMWIAAVRRDPATVVLTETDYRDIGRLTGAVSEHADELVGELVGREHVVEAVFRALSERDADGRAVRRVLTLANLVAETGLDEGDVRAVVDRFRASDCGFLLPRGGRLTLDSRIDVVHEALLRGWTRMRSVDRGVGWLEREEADGRYYRSLLARIDDGETTMQLDRVAERYSWWIGTPHTEAWARRYGGRHDRVESFFAASLKANADREAEIARAEADERERRKQRERATRRFVVAVGSVAAIALLLLAVACLAMFRLEGTTNASLVAQSNILARDAESSADRGDAADAALLAVEALPEHFARPDRPFTWKSYGALTDALGNLRERHSVSTGHFGVRARYLANGRRFVAWSEDGTASIWIVGRRSPTRLFRAGSKIYDTAISADGRYIATGSLDRTVHIWDIGSGRLLRAFREAHTILALAFSPDGRTLIASSYGDETYVYDVKRLRRIRVLAGVDGCVRQTFGSAGRVLLTEKDGAATLWDASFSAPVRRFTEVGSGSCVSPDGRSSAIVRNAAIEISDNASGRVLSSLPGESLGATEFSKNGRVFAAMDRDAIVVWNIRSAEHISTIPFDAGNDDAFVLANDGRTIAVENSQGEASIWSTATGTRSFVLAGPEKSLLSSDFDDDASKILLSFDEGAVREFDLRKVSSVVLSLTDDHIAKTETIAVTRDGGRFAVVTKDWLRVFDSGDGSLVRDLPMAFPVNTNKYIAFSPAGDRIAVSDDRSVGAKILDWRTGRVVGRVFRREPMRSIQFSPDGRSMIYTYKGMTRIVDTITGRIRSTLSASNEPSSEDYYDVAGFSDDGKTAFASTFGGRVLIFDPRTSKTIVRFKAQDAVVFARISHDGRSIATASRDKSIVVWDTSNGKPIAERRGEGVPSMVEFSADDDRLLIADTEHLRIWDIATGRTTMVFRGFDGYVGSAAFVKRDTRVVSIGSDQTVRLWPVPVIPPCQKAVDEAHRIVPHRLSSNVADAESITPRRSQPLLAGLFVRQICR